MAAAFVISACAAKHPQASSQSAAPPMPGVFTTALARLNQYRTQCGLPALTIDKELAAAAASHASYIVSNKIAGADMNIAGDRITGAVSPAAIRTESPGSPGYDARAAALARWAFVYRGDPMPSDGAPIVDRTMTYPTAAMIALNPRLDRVGYGQACEKGQCVGVALLPVVGRLIYLSDSIYRAEIDPRVMGSLEPQRLKVPIEFPPPNSSTDMAEYDGSAPTDPLTACAGYVAPTGAPLILALGHARTRTQQVEVTKHRILDEGTEVESCAFDAVTYRNPDPEREQAMLFLLKSLGAVVIIPREPLQPGHRYQVAVTADAEQYRWSFSVAPGAK